MASPFEKLVVVSSVALGAPSPYSLETTLTLLEGTGKGTNTDSSVIFAPIPVESATTNVIPLLLLLGAVFPGQDPRRSKSDISIS